MKIVVTGAAGNVSKPLTEMLIEAGHDVVVVGRSPENLAGLVERGASAAIGDLEDVSFLKETFEGADGVYLMLPPMWESSDQKIQSTKIAEGFGEAITHNGIRNAIFLSSYGAHRLDDAGAISGMGLAEVVLNRLEGVNILHLRAGYFYTNLLLSIGHIRKTGAMGNMFEVPPGKFTVVLPAEIARVAADAFTRFDFKGHSYRYVVSDETGTDEIASAIGREIGIPDLKWNRIPEADFKQVLLGYGFAEGAARDYVEMFRALDSGSLFEDYVKTNAGYSGMPIEEFAKSFAAAYR